MKTQDKQRAITLHSKSYLFTYFPGKPVYNHMLLKTCLFIYFVVLCACHPIDIQAQSAATQEGNSNFEGWTEHTRHDTYGQDIREWLRKSSRLALGTDRSADENIDTVLNQLREERKGAPCEEITWPNLFHHAIYGGKPWCT